MALTISDIKAKTKASFARPSLFTVRITLKTDHDPTVLNLNCYNAQIPGLTIATTDKDLGYRGIAYQKIYDDVLLSFYCSEDLSELEIMQKWMERISNPLTNRIGFYDDYRSTIDIIHMGRQGKRTLTTTLREAYPKKVDPMQLDYGSTDVMRMTVNFTYRYFTQVWGDVEKTGGPLYAHNVMSEENKADPMWEIRKQGWKYGQGDENDPNQNEGPDEY